MNGFKCLWQTPTHPEDGPVSSYPSNDSFNDYFEHVNLYNPRNANAYLADPTTNFYSNGFQERRNYFDEENQQCSFQRSSESSLDSSASSIEESASQIKRKPSPHNSWESYEGSYPLNQPQYTRRTKPGVQTSADSYEEATSAAASVFAAVAAQHAQYFENIYTRAKAGKTCRISDLSTHESGLEFS
ncbi:hypothetical protein Ciccas_005547 [Cichlidogyrus casuarinus]|uniref:Uncharacterized protein n=1 Tax=Cichlidogyrus casuarinus TaxID=1844966 RepID=A0ABD2Q8S2_9PLAT